MKQIPRLFKRGKEIGQDLLFIEIFPDHHLPRVVRLLHPRGVRVDGAGDLAGHGPGWILHDGHSRHVEQGTGPVLPGILDMDNSLLFNIFQYYVRTYIERDILAIIFIIDSIISFSYLKNLLVIFKLIPYIFYSNHITNIL